MAQNQLIDFDKLKNYGFDCYKNAWFAMKDFERGFFGAEASVIDFT